MLTLRTLHSILTHRNAKGFRISRTSTGLSSSHVEQRRIYLESIALMNRQIHRAWLEDAWKRHAFHVEQRRIYLESIALMNWQIHRAWLDRGCLEESRLSLPAASIVPLRRKDMPIGRST